MSEDAYATALKNTLTEIQNLCPNISHSFFFTKDGKTVAVNPETEEETIKKTVHSFRSLAEKAGSIGNLETVLIEGENGEIHFSCVKDIYLALATSKGADMTHVQSFVRVTVPTILKLLEGIAPTPLNFIPSKQLVVSTLTGFLVGDSVHIDVETLASWAKHLNKKDIKRVHVEAFGGKSAQCKVREMDEPKLKGKGIIKIPEKVCKKLEVKEGELVRVKPTES